jgi:hypothetical protein
MAKFQLQPLILTQPFTARLGAGSAVGQQLDTADVGKFVKLAGESRYDLLAVGNEIEGAIVATEGATVDGFTIGTVQNDGRLDVTFDGIQVDGTGVLAIGDIVVAGTPVAKGVASSVPPKVRKATTAANVVFKWRVVSLGSAGTGAAGTTGVIERI